MTAQHEFSKAAILSGDKSMQRGFTTKRKHVDIQTTHLSSVLSSFSDSCAARVQLCSVCKHENSVTLSEKTFIYKTFLIYSV